MAKYFILNGRGETIPVEGTLMLINGTRFFWTKVRSSPFDIYKISHLQTGSLAASVFNLSRGVDVIKDKFKQHPKAINKMIAELKRLRIKYPVNP